MNELLKAHDRHDREAHVQVVRKGSWEMAMEYVRVRDNRIQSEAKKKWEAERKELLEKLNEADRLAEQMTAERNAAQSDLESARADLAEASRAWDSPITDDFMGGVRNEAAHQIARWGSDHDAGKAPEDWFWLLGFLSGKALHCAVKGDLDKAKHHTISSAAVLMNWHAHLTGDRSRFRPGTGIGESP